MKTKKADLDKRYKKLQETPEGFAFFVSIHDFIEVIERDEALAKGFSKRIVAIKEPSVAAKYDYLKKIYQGLEDAKKSSPTDIGHDRYAAIRDLNKIRANDISESNTFWRKRELFRKMSKEIYGHLDTYLSGGAAAK